jgi:hypothetical protein
VRPPQLATSFVSNQVCDVGYWHIADKPTGPSFVGYWTNNGQRTALGLIGSAANDPKRTLDLISVLGQLCSLLSVVRSENSAAMFTENYSGAKRLDSSAKKPPVRFGGEEAQF